MLSLYLGKAFSGKTEKILRSACEKGRESGQRAIILVPEGHSHTIERRLCESCGDSASLYAEVLTFKRLSSRVLGEAGGLADKVLDDYSRLIMMNRAYDESSSLMKEYNRRTIRPDVLISFLEIYDELKNSGISPGVMENTISDCAEGRLKNKLSDLLILISAYEAQIHGSTQKGIDPTEELERVCLALETDRKLMEGIYLYIDGFTGFTMPEFNIVLNLMKRSTHLTCAFTCESLFEDEDSVFYTSSLTASRLVSAAKDEGIKIHTTVLEQRERPRELTHLETYLFTGGAEYEGKCALTALHASSSVYSECEHCACEIHRLVKSDNVRYRDITVACCDFASYRGALEAVLDRYDIPYYISGKTHIAEKPAVTAVISALRVVSEGADIEDIMGCIKIGCAGISNIECGIFENYCYAWDIRGGDILSEKKFVNNPRGFTLAPDEEEKKLLEKINDIKERIRSPFIFLKKRLKEANTGRGKAAALYEFLKIIELPSILDNRSKSLLEQGRMRESNEYERLWSTLCDCFDSFVIVCDDEIIDTDTFCRLFGLILRSCVISAIPPSVDRVQIGPIADVSSNHAPCVLLLGANDGALPSSGEGNSLLAKKERETLETLGLGLINNEAKRTSQELYNIYALISGATHRFIMSYAMSGDNGSLKHPSYYTERLKSIFPKLPVTDDYNLDDEYLICTKEVCIDLAISGNATAKAVLGDDSIVAKTIDRAMFRSDNIESRDSVRRLFGDTVRLTASRVENYNRCAFGYMARYGLGLEAKKRYSFDAPEIGTFHHYVFEGVLHRAKRLCGGIGKCEPEKLRQITSVVINEYIEKYIGTTAHRSERFWYLFERLRRSVYILVEKLREEFSLSLFEPMDFELDFSYNGTLSSVDFEAAPGMKVTMSGKVDRVDGWLNNGALYIRVADYKSGNKEFAFKDILDGTSLQLPIYLFSIVDKASEYLEHHNLPPDTKIVPSGVLYVPARNEVHKSEKDLDDETLNNILDDSYRATGFILDGEAREAMGSKFIPKQPTRAPDITSDHFDMLRKRTFDMLRCTAQLIGQGDSPPSPLVDGRYPPCEYCDYRRACHFDTRLPKDTYRNGTRVTFKEFFEEVETDE